MIENAILSVCHCLQQRYHKINTCIDADNIVIEGTGGRSKYINCNGNRGKHISRIKIWAAYIETYINQLFLYIQFFYGEHTICHTLKSEVIDNVV